MRKGRIKKGIGALLFIFAVSVIFWAMFYMNFTAYTLWAERHTDRTITSPAVEKFADKLYFLQKVNTQPREVNLEDAYMIDVKDSSGHIIKTIGPGSLFREPAQG